MSLHIYIYNLSLSLKPKIAPIGTTKIYYLQHSVPSTKNQMINRYISNYVTLGMPYLVFLSIKLIVEM